MKHLSKRLAKSLLRVGYRHGFFYVRNRTHLPLLLNARGLVGQGVEVGVAQGVYSEQLLKSWKGKRLFSVDPWREYPQEIYRDATNVRQEIHDRQFAETTARLAAFGDRSRVMRMTSSEAATTFGDGELDFVYLDAQHHHEAVKQDIALWMPKIKSGGLFAGHDYVEGDLKEGRFGVKSAVDELAKSQNLKLHVTADPPFPSWFVLIP
jgi:hypothetical protein